MSDLTHNVWNETLFSTSVTRLAVVINTELCLYTTTVNVREPADDWQLPWA
jgi:hypothetical protein